MALGQDRRRGRPSSGLAAAGGRHRRVAAQPRSAGPPQTTFPDGPRQRRARWARPRSSSGALWADRHGVAGARAGPRAQAAGRPAGGGRGAPTVGLLWRFVPVRFRTLPARAEMPNWSHGQAGILAAACARRSPPRPCRPCRTRHAGEPSTSCRLGALTDARLRGRRISCSTPGLRCPPATRTSHAWGWCLGAARDVARLRRVAHGRTSTTVAGTRLRSWQRRCLAAVRHSGVPARHPPGLLGQRRPVLRHRRCRRRLPGLLPAVRRPGRPRLRPDAGDGRARARARDREPCVVAVRRASQSRSAAAAGRGLDAGGGRHRRVPPPGRPPAPRRRRRRTRCSRMETWWACEVPT